LPLQHVFVAEPKRETQPFSSDDKMQNRMQNRMEDVGELQRTAKISRPLTSRLPRRCRQPSLTIHHPQPQTHSTTPSATSDASHHACSNLSCTTVPRRRYPTQRDFPSIHHGSLQKCPVKTVSLRLYPYPSEGGTYLHNVQRGPLTTSSSHAPITMSRVRTH